MLGALLRLFRKLSLGLSFGILVALFLLVVFWNAMVYTTPVGHTSIVWHRLFWSGDRISQGPLREGLHIILPWDKFYTYDLRLQIYHYSYQVLSNDGLQLKVDMTFRWRVVRENVVILNQTIGPDYLEKLLIPEVGSVMRESIAQFNAETLFSEQRSQVQRSIYHTLTSNDRGNGITSRIEETKSHQALIFLNDILVSKVELPEQIETAIQNKIEQSQVAQEYKFRVLREQLEVERKRTEAEGIRAFQEIVTPAISESYLRWRGIEATLKLAQSPNTKVVVIGNQKNGLPLILDTATNTPEGLFTPVRQAPSNSSLDHYLRTDQSSVEEIEHPQKAISHQDSSDPLKTSSSSVDNQ